MKKLLKFVGIFILSLAGIILLTEIGLRVTVPEKLRRWKAAKYKPDSILGYRYLPNTEDYKINVAFRNHYKINSLGFNWCLSQIIIVDNSIESENMNDMKMNVNQIFYCFGKTSEA